MLVVMGDVEVNNIILNNIRQYSVYVYIFLKYVYCSTLGVVFANQHALLFYSNLMTFEIYSISQKKLLKKRINFPFP